MISEVDWGAHETHTSGFMLSEVDWRMSSLSWSALTMMEIQRTSSPKDYGDNYQKESFAPISWST